MPVITLLRTSSATYLTLPLLTFCAFVAADERTNHALTVGGYAPAVATGPLQFLIFPASVAAGCAAWEAAKLRTSRIRELAPYRSPYSLAARVLWPLGAMVVLGMVTMNVVYHLDAGVLPNREAWPTILVGLLVPQLYLLLGFAVGSLGGTPAITGPLTTAGTWAIIGYTGNLAADTPSLAWLGHVTMYGFTAPEIDETVSFGALLLPLLFLGALVAACALWWAPWPSPVRTVVALTVAVTGVAASAALAEGWSYRTPMDIAEVSETCGSAGGVETCVPEVWGEWLPTVQASVADTLPKLERVGVRAPKRITYYRLRGEANSAQEWALDQIAGADQAALSRQIALGPLGNDERPCEGEAAQKAEILGVWLLATAELRTDAYTHAPAVTAEVKRVRSLPVDQQRLWLASALRETASCRDEA